MIALKRYLHKPHRKLHLLFVLLCIFSQSSLFSQVTTTYTSGSGSFTVPEGVLTIKIEAWGGGGSGGGGGHNTWPFAGGGGGAYASSVLSVTPGNSYNYVVGAGGSLGADGGNSHFNNQVIAAGGSGVPDNSMTGVAGGATAASTGTIKYAGGNGGDGSWWLGAPVNGPYSGSGGGGAGSSAAGGNGAPGATGGSGGAGNPDGRGGGGLKVKATNGNPGAAYGGGGGGGFSTESGYYAGGSGGNGAVRIIHLPAINGNLAVNLGGTTTLSNEVTGGTWSSATPATATINASTGLVTGVSIGTSIITYETNDGLKRTTIVTVSDPSQESSSNEDLIQILTTGAGTYTVPDRVTTLMVEVWGGGGRGGNVNNGHGGGGGGGAYSRSTISVTPGQIINYSVGAGSTTTAAGGDSWFVNSTTILAKGGSSSTNATGASGGSSGSGRGDVLYSGGNGANSSIVTTGGGGGGAGSTGNGGNANGGTAGTGTYEGGGNGGAGHNTNNSNGNPGLGFGGGGSGARGNGTGGAGADGSIRVTAYQLFENTSGTYSYTVPDGVYSLQVEVWGGGGNGGTRTSSGGTGGGGGGAYSSSVIPVIPGQTFSYTIGAAASDSYFGNNLVLAKGGSSVGNNTTGGGSGGSSGSGIGQIKFSGGNGANSSRNNGGGGGSSAGIETNGTNGSGTTGGIAPAGGGNGGNGSRTNGTSGVAGSGPGGGGGGSKRNNNGTTSGGAGAPGAVRITELNKGISSFWYKADAGTSTTTDNTGITSWTSQGDDNDAVSPASAGTGYTASTINPKYTSMLWNFNPGVNFDNGYFRFRRGAIQDDMSFFYIYSSEQTTSSGSWWLSPAIIGNEAEGTTADFGLGHNNGRLFFKSATGDNFDVQTPNNKNFNDGKPKIVSATRKKAAGGTNYLYVNGTLEGTGNSDNTSLSNAGYVGLGRNPTETASQFKGYVSEAIGKAYLVSTSERYVFESYLAVKYGLTLSNDYKQAAAGSDSTIYSVSGYGYDVAGLGRNNSWELNQKVSSSINVTSGSSRIVMATDNDFTSSNLLASRTSLSNGQYLIWGHNNAATNAWNNISGTNYKKVARVWRIQNTGNVEAVYFQIDLSAYPALPTTSTYGVLVGSNANFSGSSSFYALTHTSGNLYTTQPTFPSGTQYFTIVALPNYWHGTNTNDWGTESNWTAGIIPAPDADVEYATVANNGSAALRDLHLDQNRTIGKLINKTDKQLIIPTGKTLRVNSTIDTNGADRIWIQAAENAVNGSLLFPNETNPVYGTVEMWSKAYIDGECEQCPNDRYHWQFFGPPVHSYVLDEANSDFSGSAVRRYDESLATANMGQQWVQLNNQDVIEKFKGYEITQPAPKKLVFTGRLVNDNLSTGELAVTPGSYYKGWHLLSNPYTAAISVKDINFGTGMEETVYLYTTGSFNNWRYGLGDFGTASIWNDADAVAPGQYLAIPKNLAGFNASTAVIPSMQGFMVTVNNRNNPPASGKTVSYNYAASIGNTQKQRAPRPEAPQYVTTTVTLTGTNKFDRVWIFTDDRCTPDFDNGWDGKKIDAGAGNVSLYAIQDRDNLQIHATNDMNDTYLMVQPKQGEADLYTLHFKHSFLEAEYDQLILYDLQTGNQVDVSQDGSTYSFSIDPNDTEVRRFKLVTQPIVYEELDVVVFTQDQKIAVHNYMRKSGNIKLYDISGKLMHVYPLDNLGVTTLPYTLAKGVYLVNVEIKGIQTTKKILVH